MKYLIMIHSNPAFRELWDKLPDEKRAEFRHGHVDLSDELPASGEYVVAEGLADPSLARSVTVRNGQAVASDGPFAEAKEYLVGFYLVDCDSMERALEHAAKVPDAKFGRVEVRPVLDVKGLDL